MSPVFYLKEISSRNSTNQRFQPSSSIVITILYKGKRTKTPKQLSQIKATLTNDSVRWRPESEGLGNKWIRSPRTPPLPPFYWKHRGAATGVQRQDGWGSPSGQPGAAASWGQRAPRPLGTPAPSRHRFCGPTRVAALPAGSRSAVQVGEKGASPGSFHVPFGNWAWEGPRRPTRAQGPSRTGASGAGLAEAGRGPNGHARGG